MASPQAPEDQITPRLATSEQRHDSPQSSSEGLQRSKGKEKKKVGFASDRGSHLGTLTSSSFLTPDEAQSATQDYFSYNPSPHSDGSTPLINNDGPTKRDSFDKEELTAALAQILETNPQQAGPVHPSKPRPVLRKPTVLLSPADVLGEPLPSEIEAKNRADRLAYSVGTSSVPVSRRTSFDSESVSVLERDSFLRDPTASVAQDLALPAGSNTLRPRRKAYAEAENLVESHAHRNDPHLHSFTPPRSGAATPVDHDLEYVPRPEKYKGGILGTLLKLYGSGSEGSSTAYLTSSAPSTPGRTPNGSPLSTPTPSRPGTPKPEKGRRGWRTQSSSTLSGLLESSFVFAAPGSSKDISEAVLEKVKLEKERSERSKKAEKAKKKLDKYRIKIHIAEIIKRHAYLLKLCHALMIYGAPTHRLEAYMRMSARVLGIEGQFMYLPDTMIISFDDSNTHTTEVRIVRATQGLDFGRLRDVHEIYKEVVHDRIGVEEATMRLNEVTSRKPKFPVWLRVILYGIASAAVAPFGFEGRYIDMPICFILGCLVGFLQLYLAPSNELYANVFEITAAVATSFLARVFGSIRGGRLFCFSALAQASIALILPGYMVLCASLELQSHQMVSGSVRMVYALIYTLFLGYGITIGTILYGYMDENAVSSIHCSVGDSWYTKRPPENYYIFFVLAFTLCLCAINQAKWKQTPVQVFVSLAGFVVNNFSSRFFKGNSTISSSLGALTIGVLANLYSRLGRYTQNWCLDIWERHVERRLWRLTGKPRPVRYHESPYYSNTSGADSQATVTGPGGGGPEASKEGDLEMGPSSSNGVVRHARKIGYGLAAAAMLPAIFVQVPSGLAASGSLLSGVSNADQITRNATTLANGTVIYLNATHPAATSTSMSGDLNATAFNVLLSVIQVAINISVGLSLSALLVYPFGKRRSGLFSF